jgi:antitoxin (DNA-binding transcriptional repressor) of toxin-antitoxin stability system
MFSKEFLQGKIRRNRVHFHHFFSSLGLACVYEKVTNRAMKTVSLSALSRRWLQIEKTLQAGHEVVVTRYGKPVAKLVGMPREKPRGKRWDPEAHMRWLNKIWGNRIMPSSDAFIARDRADWWEKEAG